MIRYAIFDIDGTVLDTSVMWETLPVRYLKMLDIRCEDAELSERLRSKSLLESAAYLRGHYDIPYSVDEIIRQITRMTERFYNQEAALRDGIPRLLAGLRSYCVRMSIATSGDRELCMSALTRHGIDGFFEGIASCSDYGAKTSPEVFLAAADIVCAIPGETLVFEDSLFAVRTAKNAGFFTAAVRDISEGDQTALRETATYYALSPGDYCERLPEILKVTSKNPV